MWCVLNERELNDIIFHQIYNFLKLICFYSFHKKKCWICSFDCIFFFHFAWLICFVLCAQCTFVYKKHITCKMECIFFNVVCFFLSFPLSRMEKLFPKRFPMFVPWQWSEQIVYFDISYVRKKKQQRKNKSAAWSVVRIFFQTINKTSQNSNILKKKTSCSEIWRNC